MPPSGGQPALGGHWYPDPGCCRDANLPILASPASIPIPTDPCSSPARPASSPPTLAHLWRLCKAPPRQGRRNLPQVQLVNHIKSGPVESLGVHPAQGERWELVREPQLSRELQPPETTEATLVAKSEVLQCWDARWCSMHFLPAAFPPLCTLTDTGSRAHTKTHCTHISQRKHQHSKQLVWLHELYFIGFPPRTDQRVREVEIADVAIKVWYRACGSSPRGRLKASNNAI